MFRFTIIVALAAVGSGSLFLQKEESPAAAVDPTLAEQMKEEVASMTDDEKTFLAAQTANQQQADEQTADEHKAEDQKAAEQATDEEKKTEQMAAVYLPR